ncbi:MAG: homocysteine S-methyltransferase family protein [Verrucomicrobiales bacterium]|nr:homocysteine S-methyltransferase family protein [Verrucomicrobiales bacterium]
MSKYRDRLPQLSGRLFLADGGLETTLMFHEGVDLPYFAAFDLLKDATGTAILHRYFARYAEIARNRGLGVVLESPTWRANPDWAAKLGYDAASLAEVNRRGIALLAAVRDEFETTRTPIVLSGNLGPRGDGYRVESRMTARQARDYHAPQVDNLAKCGADMIAGFTMNYAEEAIGIANAARETGIPAAIAFTVETDGRLPSGQTLAEAIEQTDTDSAGHPAYYMINCAHPTHLESAVREPGAWRGRLRGLRANSSKRSHAELDASPDIDIGDPGELGREYRALRETMPHLTVLGGCCGTDHRHIEAICAACHAAEPPATTAPHPALEPPLGHRS